MEQGDLERGSIESLIIFWISILIGIPMCVLACRFSKILMYLCFSFMIYSLVAPHWSITFLSHETYKAATRGFEVHISDLMAIILFISMLIRREEFKIQWFPPLLIPMLLFFAMGWVSWIMIGRENLPIYDLKYGQDDLKPMLFFDISLFPLFELSKIARGIFIFWVSFNFLQDKKAYKYLAGSFSAVAIYIFGAELYGRYVQGQYRPDFGGFQFNDLNTYSGITTLTIFPLAFVVRSFFGSFWYWSMMLCGFFAIALTVSRSSMAGFALGAFLIVVVMIFRYPTVRNFGFIVLTSLMAFLFLLKAADTLLERFTVAEYTADIDERVYLNKAAYLMGEEHFFGVGLGNFSAWEVNEYGDRVGANPYNIPHNIWFLTFAEVGYMGLFFFALMWIRFYHMLFSSMRIFKKFSSEVYGYSLLLGIFSASIVMQFQNRYHFTYRQTSIYFTMHIIMAITARAYANRRQVVRKYADEHREELKYS